MERSSPTVDRISVLPDVLLRHILSFLDASEVVQTSLLSRSWRHVWISVPVLNFNEHLWLKDCHTDEERQKGNRRFLSFVDHVLLDGDFRFTKFNLNSDIAVRQPSRIENWIFAAVGRQAQELHIKIRSKGRLRIPTSLFSSPITIFSMQIPYAQLPNTICSSAHLRTLHLVSARLPIVYPGSELVFSCPVLENLTIKDCNHMNTPCLGVYALQLINLVVELNDGVYAPVCDIRLRTPNLVSLKCKGYMYGEYKLENVSSLVTADISPKASEIVESKRLGRLLEGLKGHCNAAITLTLPLAGSMFKCFRWSTLVEFLPSSLPSISHLKLIMERERSCIIAVADLLKRFTCIETLAFEILEEEGEYIIMYNETDRSTFECMFHRLKSVTIHNVVHGQNVLEFLEFVTRSAPALENITITTTKVLSRNEEKLAEFTRKVHCLPRASSSVTVLFEMQLD